MKMVDPSTDKEAEALKILLHNILHYFYSALIVYFHYILIKGGKVTPSLGNSFFQIQM